MKPPSYPNYKRCRCARNNGLRISLPTESSGLNNISSCYSEKTNQDSLKGMRVFRVIARTILPRRLHISAQLHKEILKRCEGRIAQGLFGGLRYVSNSYGSAWIPKMLGTYELELVDALEDLLVRTFDVAVVVGAAEGYYAVGLGTLHKIGRVIAFEPNKEARRLIAELAHLNGVDSDLDVHGICDARGLSSALVAAQKPLVLMDIEGGEAILLDPEVVFELRSATIVVELHEFAVPGVTDLVKKRFAVSHAMLEIKSRPREVADYPFPLHGAMGRIKRGAAIQAMAEHRPPGMSWLVMTPKAD